MEWFIKAFIRASLIWFTLGIALGIAMSARPEWVMYRPAHAHMNVVGFLVMMVFGVGYQLLPRLFGGPLWSATLAVAHLWLANLGLAAMVAGFMLAPHIGARRQHGHDGRRHALHHWRDALRGEPLEDVRSGRRPPPSAAGRGETPHAADARRVSYIRRVNPPLERIIMRSPGSPTLRIAFGIAIIVRDVLQAH